MWNGLIAWWSDSYHGFSADPTKGLNQSMSTAGNEGSPKEYPSPSTDEINL